MDIEKNQYELIKPLNKMELLELQKIFQATENEHPGSRTVGLKIVKQLLEEKYGEDKK